MIVSVKKAEIIPNMALYYRLMKDVRTQLTSNALIVLLNELIFNLLDLFHSCGYHIQSMRFPMHIDNTCAHINKCMCITVRIKNIMDHVMASFMQSTFRY